jgi:hypothetical protein
MIHRPTVLVLGAGASNPYGFPLGRELRDIVCGLATSDCRSIIADAGFDVAELSAMIDALRHSGYSSVDWFLEDRPEFMRVGKAAIAAAMIPLEDPDRLFPPAAPFDHWYEVLLNTMDTPRGAFPDNHVGIVTFNYDRSLEYYLHRILEMRRGSLDRAAEELRSIDIVHVHGTLGALAPTMPNGRAYAPDLTAEALRVAVPRIVVVGEASGEAAEFRRARKLLEGASKIVFLGVGFHPESIRRLDIFGETWNDQRRARVSVTGTRRGIPVPAWQKINSEVLMGTGATSIVETDVYSYLTNREPLDA